MFSAAVPRDDLSVSSCRMLHIPLFGEPGQLGAARPTAAVKRASLRPSGGRFTYGIYVELLYLPAALTNLSFPSRCCHQL